MRNHRFLIVCTTLFVLATLAPVGGAVEAPAVPDREATLRSQCTPSNADSQVVTPPAAPFGPGWVARCVTVPVGGTVTFTQADFFPHGAQSIDGGLGNCIDLPVMGPGGSNSVTFDLIDEGRDTLTLGAFGSDESIHGCGVVDETTQTVSINYMCRIHGTAMIGRIVVEL